MLNMGNLPPFIPFVHAVSAPDRKVLMACSLFQNPPGSFRNMSYTADLYATANIFNIFGILGVAPLINPIKARGISYQDMILMLAVSIVLYPIMKSGMKISRKEGIFLLLIYVVYTANLMLK